MEKTCPRCGKVVIVSHEELSMREGVAVCPQCLAAFDMDGQLRSPQPQVKIRQAQPASGDTGRPMPTRLTAQPLPQHEGYSYCPECGKRLPPQVNFCPYCGIRLASSSTPAPGGEATPSSTPPAPAPHASSPAPSSAEPEPQLAPALAWTPVFPTVQYRMRKWGSAPASLRTRAVGYTVIIVLLALFAFIVYQGMLISY